MPDPAENRTPAARRRGGGRTVPLPPTAAARTAGAAGAAVLIAVLAGCDGGDAEPAPEPGPEAAANAAAPDAGRDAAPEAAGAPEPAGAEAVATGTEPGTGSEPTPATGGPDHDVDPLAVVLDALPPPQTVAPAETPPLPEALVPLFQMIEAGRPDVARVRLRRHLAVHPEDGIAHFLFGLAYHRERQYSEAAPWMTNAIARRPDYGPAIYFAGWGRFYLGDLDLAERLWRRHVRMQPEFADTHFGLGLVDLERGRPEAAAGRFRRAIELEKDQPGRERSVAKAWARLGDALTDLGKPAEARTAVERAVELWPDHHEAWARLARLARRLGDPGAAERAEAEAEAARSRVAAGDARP